MALTTKTEIRKEFLIQRNALDAESRARNSSLIRQRIFQHRAWKNATRILCYVSFGSEVETHLLIQEALRFKKKVAVPIHDGLTRGTPLSELQRFTDLGPNHRGVLQIKPDLHRILEPSTIELAIVPGITFDRQGGRIGFGGGYFDRLFPTMPDAVRMALSFNSQMVDASLPLEPHDVRMDFIVTETGVQEFRRTAV